MTIPSTLPWLVLLCGVISSSLSTLRAQNSTGEGQHPAVRVVRDLPYVAGGSAQQRLDLYLPAVDKEQGLHPLVIWLHGGGWEGGNRHSCPAQPLASRGYVVASVDYRLSFEAIYPAQIEDCKAAVRWLRAHSGEYGIDPAHIGVWGGSAGGHLAGLLGTTGGTRRFDVGADLDQTSSVQCVLDWFGPSDLLHWGDPPVEWRLDTPNTSLARLLGGPVHLHEDLARAASPVDFVDAHSAPFFIMHGDRDNIVPLQQSIVLNNALRKAGVESELQVVEGAGHGAPQFSTPENIRLMTAFFERHLHPAAAR